MQSLCILCGQYDITENLCAAGALHATTSKLNEHHVAQLTNKWREMAILVMVIFAPTVPFIIGVVLSICAIGIRKNVMSVKNEIDIDQVKEAAYDKVIAFINETSNESESGFDLQELERLYLEYLSQFAFPVRNLY